MHSSFFLAQLVWSARAAFPAIRRSILWLLALIIPISLAVTLLDYAGLLGQLARLLEPVMRWLGLPGEAALVVLTAFFLNIYSAIAIMQTLALTTQQATIAALICLIAHNLPVEIAVQRRAGASGRAMLALRLAAAFAGAWLLKLFMPDCDASPISPAVAALTQNHIPLMEALASWGKNTLALSAKIAVLVAAIMIVQRWLADFGWLHKLTRWLQPPLALLGLPKSTAFLWLVVNGMGLAYGAAVIFEYTADGKIPKTDLRLFNCHAAIAHSLLEDTLLFVAIGVPVFWIIWPRLFLAALVVWLCRAWRARRT